MVSGAWPRARRARCGIAGLAVAALLRAGGPAMAAPVAPPPDPLVETAREVGRYGGRFVIGQTAGPRTFNPLVANEQNSNDICDRLFVSLTTYDNALQRDVPCIARSWTFSADRRTVTYRLRRGMRFSDGHPLTADDVKFSFDVALDDSLPTTVKDNLTYADPATGRRTRWTYRVLDSLTFAVTSPLPSALAISAAGTVRIVPKHVLERAWREGRYAAAYGLGTRPEDLVTSGPWRLARQVPGEQVVLGRNPWWFGVDARGRRLPYLDELVFLIVPDQNAAALRFRSGELDAVDNVRPEDYRGYEQSQAAGRFVLHDVGPSLTTSFLWFNLNLARDGRPAVGRVKYAWFSNPVFRRAVSLAIDRDAIIRGPYHGCGIKNWQILTPASCAWNDPSVTAYDHDPAAARRLLASLGWKDRNGDGVLEDRDGNTVSFTIATNADNTMRQDVIALVADDLARVGIRASAAPVEMSALVAHLRNDFQYDAALLGLGPATPPDPGMFPNVLKSSGITHYWHVRQDHPATPEEARLDSLFERNVYALNAAVRKRTYHEIAELMAKQCWFVWLPSQQIRIPVRARFGNVQPTVVPHRVLWNSDRLFVRAGAE